jgi:Cu-processing system permease protein
VSAAAIPKVAGAVFKESVRDRVPLSLVLFSVVLMAAAYLMSQLTAGQDLKVIKDLGLATMNAIGLLIALFIGTGLVAKEVERRSIYAILTKPVTRRSFLLGKFAGLALTLAVNLGMMTVAYYAMLWYFDRSTDAWIKGGWRAPAMDVRLLVPIVLIGLQLLLTTAAAMFFSTFTSPLLAVLFTTGFWVAGHFSADLKELRTAVDSPVAAAVARAAYYVLPNLSTLDVKNEVVHGGSIAWPALGIGVSAAVTYIAVLLTASVAVFGRRDFK